MYLSIGNDMAVRERAIVGIFDLDNTSTSQRTRAFLDRCEPPLPSGPGRFWTGASGRDLSCPAMTCPRHLSSLPNTVFPAST